MAPTTPSRALLEAGAPAPPARSSLPAAEEVAPSLRKWLGVDMSILDVDACQVVHEGADQLPWRIGGQWELCRQVADRGRAEFIADEDALLVLAIPLAGHDSPLVAVGGFLTRVVDGGQDAARLARQFGVEEEALRRWAHRQTPVRGDTLERLAGLVLDHLSVADRADSLQHDVEKLTAQLCGMYEEVSLIYRLTHNLTISRSGSDLARLTLDWLLEVVPARGVAVLLWRPEASRDLSGAEWITAGEGVISRDEFALLMRQLQLVERVRPLVLNRPGTAQLDGMIPRLKELIAVPLLEGERLFGWLVALNHAEGGEFGTIEADLLTSASAILGIHCGNIELYDTQADALASFVRAMTSAIDAKDAYTRGHSERVARVAVRLAQELGCPRQLVERLYLGGLLHDVGKIGISDEVLSKPGKLTAEEFEHIKQHTRIGYNILVDIKQLADVLPIVLYHHEAWDGSGYPDKLAGENIPFVARITAVADAFDAMQSDRIYRRGLTDEQLDTIIRGGAGKQWDAQVVSAFFSAREDIRHIAKSELGEPPVDLKHCFGMRK
ncbi:MAG: HD-GYP domain-containing protein [Planctomycetia bacterium]|nr:HD-GYP domain-containing protein [Planctomycetia bacterium]